MRAGVASTETMFGSVEADLCRSFALFWFDQREREQIDRILAAAAAADAD